MNDYDYKFRIGGDGKIPHSLWFFGAPSQLPTFTTGSNVQLRMARKAQVPYRQGRKGANGKTTSQ